MRKPFTARPAARPIFRPRPAGTALATAEVMTKAATIIGAAVLAGAVGLSVALRPKLLGDAKLPESTSIPPAARQVIRSKMNRHDVQMRTLLSRVVLLDDDGTARVAGEIFDEPALARPVSGEELNGLLPNRFFTLQDELRASARRLVIASGRHDHGAMAEELGVLTKTCVSCHQVFLYGEADQAANAERR
jgi:hypothetical protein